MTARGSAGGMNGEVSIPHTERVRKESRRKANMKTVERNESVKCMGKERTERMRGKRCESASRYACVELKSVATLATETERGIHIHERWFGYEQL